MNYDNWKEVELDLNPKLKQIIRQFRFSVGIIVTAAVTGDKIEWNAEVVPSIPKRPGRPKKVSPEPNFKLVRASDLDLGTMIELNDAASFVQQTLKNGPRLSGEIFAEAVEYRLAKKAVYRAARMLDVIKKPVGQGKEQRWYWELPHDDNKPAELAHTSEGGENLLDPQGP